MTLEPSDAETCLHVSISEANKSSLNEERRARFDANANVMADSRAEQSRSMIRHPPK